MKSGPILVTARSRQFGLRLPYLREFTGMTAIHAHNKLNDYWVRYQASRQDWSCILTYCGMVVQESAGRSIESPREIADLLLEIEQKRMVEITVFGPETVSRGLDGVLEWLYASGCGGVLLSKRWRLLFATNRHQDHPWAIAQVHLMHDSVNSVRLTEDNQELHWRPGMGLLRDQFLTLPLFAVETGYHLHYHIFLYGLNGWRTTINAWNLDLVCYTVEEHQVSIESPKSYLLRRVEGPGLVITEATVEVKDQ